MTPFGRDLRVLAMACDDLRSLWSSSNLHAIERTFFTFWSPNASWPGLAVVSGPSVRARMQGCTEMVNWCVLANYVQLACTCESVWPPTATLRTQVDISKLALTCDSVWPAQHKHWAILLFQHHQDRNYEGMESLNPTKSMGWDMIPPKILKLATKELASSLTSIFNLAINSGGTPKQLEKRRMDSCS